MKRYLILLILFAFLQTAKSQTSESDTVWVKEIGSEVKAVKFSPDGQFIYAAAIGRKPMKLSTVTGEILREYEGLTYYNRHPRLCLDLSNDGKLIYGADQADNSNTMYIWDTETGALLHTLHTDYEEWQKAYYKSISVSEKYIAGHVAFKISEDEYESETHIWDRITFEKIKVINTSNTNMVEFSPSGKYLALFNNQKQDEQVGTVLLYTENWENYHDFIGHTESVEDIAFSPDGSLLASGGWDGVIKIWDVNQKKLMKEIKNAHGFGDIAGYIYSLQFINNSLLVSGGTDHFKNNILFWNWQTEFKLRDYLTIMPFDLTIHNSKLGIADYNNIILVDFDELVSVKSDRVDGKLGNKPNPFQLTTEIQFVLPFSGIYNISIIDSNGREIEVLHNGLLEQGEHKFQWIPKGIPAGIYFCNITGQNFSKTLKIILEK